MKQNKEQKWYAVEYDRHCSSAWNIEDELSRDVLWSESVGEEQAEKNARLCAMAPQWKQIAGKLYHAWVYLRNDTLKEAIQEYKQLIEEENEKEN